MTNNGLHPAHGGQFYNCKNGHTFVTMEVSSILLVLRGLES